jgi:hypothetical protein
MKFKIYLVLIVIFLLVGCSGNSKSYSTFETDRDMIEMLEARYGLESLEIVYIKGKAEYQAVTIYPEMVIFWEKIEVLEEYK